MSIENQGILPEPQDDTPRFRWKGGWIPTTVGVSFIVSLATAYIFFIALLQTTEVSPFRLGLAGAVLVTSWAGTFIAGNRWVHRRLAALPGINRSLLVCLVLPALLLPAIFRGPAFPKSPFFRPWSELAIEFTASPLNPGAVPLPTGGVKLRLGDERTLNRHQFDPNGGWSRQGKTLLLGPGSVARLDWVGVVPRSVELAIDPPAINGRLVVRWDETVTAVELDANSKAPIVLQRLFPIPWGYSAVLFLSLYVVFAASLVILLAAFPGVFGSLLRLRSSSLTRWLAVLLIALLSTITVWLQVQSLPGGVSSLGSMQMPRHLDVLSGRADDPWQYRVLSEVILEALIRLLQTASVQQAFVPVFVGVRLLQNALLLFLAFALYQKVTSSAGTAFLGMLVLAACMTRVFYDSDLAFNTYFDVIFYLLAALLLLARNYLPVVPLVALAALNRETSALIPFMAVAAVILQRDASRRNLLAALLSGASYIIVIAALRGLMADRPLAVPYDVQPGLALLTYNLSRQTTGQQLFATLGVLPLLGLAVFGRWPALWRAYFLVLCPAWFAIHAVGAVLAETRLILVPIALILIPGAMFLVLGLLDPQEQSAGPTTWKAGKPYYEP